MTTKISIDRQQIVNTVREYVSNPKVLAGLLLIGFSIYTAATDIPQKYQKYTDAKKQGETLLANKNNLIQERNKMEAISKELEKYPIKVFEVQSGHSPQLDVLGVAQQIASMSEAFQNVYLSLSPQKESTIEVDKIMTLPVNASPGGAGATPASSPAPAPGAAASPSSTASSEGAGLKMFEYELQLRGTYVNLAAFMNKLVQFENAIVLQRITLVPKPENSDTPVDGGSDDIFMTIKFAIPWK